MLNWLVLLALAVSLTGCKVGKKDARRDHKSAAAPVEDLSSTPIDRKSNYFGLDLNALYGASLKASPAVRIREIIQPLSAVLLKQSNLSDPKFKGHSQTSWALSFLNDQMVKALKESATDESLAQILETYRTLLLSGCNSQSLTGCRNIKFLSRDPQLAGLIKVLALQTTDIKAYFRLISLAYEVQSDVLDPELEKLIYARMSEFLRLFIEVSVKAEMTSMKLRNLSIEQRRDFTFYTGFFATALRASSGTTLAGPQALELLQWISSNQLEAVLGGDLAFLISDLVSKQLASPEMWEKFTGIFLRTENAEEMSYTNSLKRVTAMDNNLLGRLGVQAYDLESSMKNRSKDLAAVFFLSRIFDLRPSSRERYLWKMAQMTPEQSLDLIEAFVRVTMVDRAMDTHRRLADYYQTRILEGEAQTILLPAVMLWSDQNLTPRWKDYVSRVQKIEEFFAEEIERPFTGQKDSPLAAQILKVRNLFEELNPSIKYMVTYPNMIMLGYYAAKLNMNMWVTGQNGEQIQINKNLILHDLMEGNLPPLFTFTSFKASEARRNLDKIDSVQMSWALYFTLAMQVPELYKVPSTDFLATFIETYRAPTDKRLRELIKTHEELLQPNSDITNLLSYCSHGPGTTGIFPNAIELAQIPKATFLGELGSDSLPPLRTAVQKVSLNASGLKQSFDEAVEVLRSDVDPKLRRIHLVKSAFQSTRPNDSAAVRYIDSMLSETMALRGRLMQTSRTLINELPSCMLRMRDIEEERRRQLIAMEQEHIRIIKVALQAIGSSANEKAGLASLKTSETVFSNLDLALPTHVALNQALIKALNFERSAFTRIDGYRADYFSLGGFQRDGTGKLFYNYRRSDLLIRQAVFMLYGFEGRTISRSLDVLTVNFPVSMKDLARAIGKGVFQPTDLQIYNMVGDKITQAAHRQFATHISWLGDRNYPTFIYRTFLRMTTALYKYESLGDLAAEGSVFHPRAGAERLLEMSQRMLDSLRLRPSDEALLKAFDTPSFYNMRNERFNSVSGPQKLFLSTEWNSRVIGLGDEVFIYLSSLRLGFDPLFRFLRPTSEVDWARPELDNANQYTIVTSDSLMTRAHYFRLAQSYYLSLRDKSRLLQFAIPTEIDQQIDLFHTRLIRNDLKLTADFLEIAAQWDHQNPQSPTQFDLRVEPEPLKILGTSMVGNYQALIKKFHQDTSQVFAD